MSEANENDNSSSTMNSTDTPKPHTESLVKDNLESPLSDKPKKKTMSIRRSVRGSVSQGTLKATVLTFQALKSNPAIARIQILLCNISERDIFAKLKCSTSSNVTALPSSSGHISPKSQLRLLLTWKRPENVKNWKEAGMPKILLTTYFLSQHGQVSLDEEPTNTRLVGRVSTSKECSPDDPPIEQLLLDAVGKDAAVIQKTQSPPPIPIIPKEEESYKEDNDDSQWLLLLLLLFVFLLLLQQK